MGLVALEAFGDSVALVCMALAALYPVLVELSGTLVAENLLLVFELAAIWTALRARRSGRPYAWIAATGVLTGLATLTHENAIVIIIPLAFGVAAAGRSIRPREPDGQVLCRDRFEHRRARQGPPATYDSRVRIERAPPERWGCWS